MVFSSLLFIFYFLPAALGLYYLAPRRYKNLVLFLCSLFFYAWGEPVYIVLMLFSAAVDYSAGRLMGKYNGNKAVRRWCLTASVLVNLSLLGFFKYADFLIANLNFLLGSRIAPLNLPLPIGISFYTFQTMSYTIDVYRGQTDVQKDFIAFAAYVSLFPQLIAGPIVRYSTVAHQLRQRSVDAEKFALGIKRFAVGLGKKVLLANNIGQLWAQIKDTAPADLPVLTAWLGIVAFAFQIYYDFSGYSDMAIGLGKMFGFDFLENFNYPYIARSVAEFWRRWHISLGTWFRDYLYIPLGGNRGGAAKAARNLLIVWFATGFWHGASWNFVLWGLYFGALIVLERLFLQAWLRRLPAVLSHLYLLLAVCFGWVIFEFNGPQALAYLRVMLGLGNNALLDPGLIYMLATNGVLLVILGLGATPLPNALWEKVIAPRGKRRGAVLAPAFCLLILVVATAYLVDSSYNPFLYFRF
ncbi:MAG: MBOAT family protein [Firmicutes bacterium]|nr:MBOAT family protein [Bacillota bacterium]HPZ90880.1 MBOAT family protein [Bacillota bacterium]HQE02108.1 MBOAT family protein [Bacillota bacterium]